MFKIGEFSRFTRVSVKTLRHYDEMGLLTPRLVDRFTNYRYYSADQVPRLNQILALRELGFSLEQIGHLLAARLSPEQLRGMFDAKRLEIGEQIQAQEEKLRRVDTFLEQLSDSAAPRYDVVVRQVEPLLVASIRSWVAYDEGAEDHGDSAIEAIFEEVEEYVARFRARAPLPPAMICHDREYRADGQEVEVAIPVTAKIAATDRIRIYELAGCEAMACLIHTGGYEQLTQTLGALLRWVESNHYAIGGPMRELFLRFGAQQSGYALPESYLTVKADELVTELQVPVMKRDR